MNNLHNELKSEQMESRDLQQDFLCSDENSSCCSTLDYKYITTTEETINKAFDLLFAEVIKMI